MKLHIFDSNNWVRRVHETDYSGLALRNLFTDAYHNPDPVIYVFDGKDAKAGRRAIYPEYKANRTPAPDAFYAVMDTFKKLLAHTNKLMIEIPGYEADDVIAHLVRSDDSLPVMIHSNDADYLALCNERVTMTDVSAKFKDLSRADTRLYKTLVGDPSDNIKGIAKFGPKAFEALSEDQKFAWRVLLDKEYLLQGTNAELLGLTKSQWGWTEKNFPTLVAYWRIINFIDVPLELIATHTRSGKPDLAAANALLRSVMQ